MSMGLSRGLKDLCVTASSRAGVMAVTLMTQSFLAWALGPEGRGEYAVCITLSTFSATAFLWGMDWATTYFVAAQRRSWSRSVTLAFGYVLLAGTVLAPALYLVGRWPVAAFLQVSDEALLFTALLASATLGYTLAASILRGIQAFSLLAALAFAKVTATLLLTIVLVDGLEAGVAGPIIADTLSGLGVSGFVVVYLTSRRGWRPEPPGTGRIREMFSYGGRQLGASVAAVAGLRVGILVLASFQTTREVGLFALALAVLGQLGAVADVLNSVLVPRIATSAQGREDLVPKACRLLSTTMLLVGLLLLATAGWWLPTLFSPRFESALVLLWLLFPGVWLRATAKALFAHFNGIGRPEVVSRNSGLNLALHGVLLALLVPALGPVGAAVAFTTANLVGFAHIAGSYRRSAATREGNLLWVSRYDLRFALSQALAR